MIKVVVADDQELVRSGFALILGSDPGIEVVAQASDGLEAIAAVRRHVPDVVLMDIRMPGMDGIEATGLITGAPESADVRVLVVTTFDDDEYVVEALRAGASGFLVKDTAPQDLIHAVTVVASGDALLTPAITLRMIDRLCEPPHRRPRSTCPTSRCGRSRCCARSPGASRTTRSPRDWWSATRP